MLLEPTPPLGLSIPPRTPHTVIRSLPLWEDNVAVCMGKGPELKESTYPRFGIHPCVEQLSSAISKELGVTDEPCFLFPTALLAEEFRSYIDVNFPSASCVVRRTTDVANAPPGHSIFAAFFTAGFRDAMKFYTFSGNGVSPRLAEVCLQRRAGIGHTPLSLPTSAEHCAAYYLKHAPLPSVDAAKRVLRTRYSGMFGDANIRGVPGACPEDVYLYASGMQAIWRTHKLLHATLNTPGEVKRKVAHVNLLYSDTYKFLELPDGSGYEFFTNDTIDQLEALLEAGSPSQPAVLAIFTDFPGNPHLRSADMIKLHNIAQCYGVPLIVDETVGGYLNVSVLPHCDIVVSSLTKLFSGMANVLGGAIMLNPTSRFYSRFKETLEATYEDSLFDHDALILEMNSREYVQRTIATNQNAEKLSDMLYPLSQTGGAHGSVLQAVHYPKYRTRENFDRLRNPLAHKAGLEETGYGSLLSITFTSLEAAKVFYGALQCYKGVTLGTVFTLATAFCAIAFPPDKMEWIEERGVEESLIRFSVGMEDTAALLKCIRDALDAASSMA
ncbi:pyridoxal phosphate-dependent transferase [Mycena amicta]|nr:pyridoxal phosphate-dependent transferase [Mycena amicta]